MHDAEELGRDPVGHLLRHGAGSDPRLEVVRDVLPLRQHVGVVGRELVVTDEALAPGGR